jgi:hypothetical protein
MKNIIKLIGIIALVVVIGFSFTACGDDDDDNGGGGGTFTLTNIPSEYNGKYLSISYEGTYYNDPEQFWGSTDEYGSQHCFARISNGRASIPLWAYSFSAPDEVYAVRYTRTETVPCRVDILNADGFLGWLDEVITFYINSVSFTNGSATKSWNDIDGFN